MHFTQTRVAHSLYVINCDAGNNRASQFTLCRNDRLQSFAFFFCFSLLLLLLLRPYPFLWPSFLSFVDRVNAVQLKDVLSAGSENVVSRRGNAAKLIPWINGRVPLSQEIPVEFVPLNYYNARQIIQNNKARFTVNSMEKLASTRPPRSLLFLVRGRLSSAEI